MLLIVSAGLRIILILWQCLTPCLKGLWLHFNTYPPSTKWIHLFTTQTKWQIFPVENLSLNLDSLFHTESVLHSSCVQECSEVLVQAGIKLSVQHILFWVSRSPQQALFWPEASLPGLTTPTSGSTFKSRQMRSK